MAESPEEDRSEELLEAVSDAIERESLDDVRALVEPLHPAEIAYLLESLPQHGRDVIWEQIEEEMHADVLAELEDEVRTGRLMQMEPGAVATAAIGLETDDAVDLLQDLPEEVVQDVLRAMDEQHRARLESAMAFPEDTAGGLMNLDTLTVRGDVSLEVVQRYLRLKGDIPTKLSGVMVVDRDNHYVGTLPIVRLITGAPETRVGEVLDTRVPAIPAMTPDSEVAKIFEQRDLIVAPVVDDEGTLLGHVFVDDVVDVIRDEGEHQLMSMAGLDEEEDMFAPAVATARKRTVWLGVNLATALLAAWVIGLFEATIEEVVALAVLMPVVASMGGIAGTQTLTVVIRGMALGQIGMSNLRWLLVKELLVGFMNSLFWALVMAGIALAWFRDGRLGAIIAVALVINLVVAALAGACIPLVLRRLAIDPALAGGVILTTVTDVIGFMAFLGLGTVFLLA